MDNSHYPHFGLNRHLQNYEKQENKTGSYKSNSLSFRAENGTQTRDPAWKASALSTELFPQNNLWAVMDSNHRRLRQLSYSQPHLATLVTAQL